MSSEVPLAVLAQVRAVPEELAEWTCSGCTFLNSSSLEDCCKQLGCGAAGWAWPAQLSGSVPPFSLIMSSAALTLKADGCVEHAEFVVYNDVQVLPEYLIKYKHRQGCKLPEYLINYKQPEV